MKSHRCRPTVLLVVNLQNGKEGFLWNFHAAHLLHALLTGFLLFEQLLLTRDIATVAFRQHVLSQSLHVFASNNVGARWRPEWPRRTSGAESSCANG